MGAVHALVKLIVEVYAGKASGGKLSAAACEMFVRVFERTWVGTLVLVCLEGNEEKRTGFQESFSGFHGDVVVGISGTCIEQRGWWRADTGHFHRVAAAVGDAGERTVDGGCEVSDVAWVEVDVDGKTVDVGVVEREYSFWRCQSCIAAQNFVCCFEVNSYHERIANRDDLHSPIDARNVKFFGCV